VDYGHLSSQEDHGTLKLRLRRRSAAPGTGNVRRLWLIEHSMTIISVTPVADIDAAAVTRQDAGGGSRKGSKGNAVRALQHNAAAAPATVSGEPAT
jgi:hypothetical protein